MLILRTHNESDALYVVGNTKRPIGSGELGALSEGEHVVLAVPGEHVLLTSVSVVAKSKQRLRQAVPFALEGQLLDDVSRLHFALGDQDGDTVVVAVAAASNMRQWLKSLGKAAARVTAVVPDVLLLPWRSGTLSLAFDGDRALVRTGASAGFVCDRDSLSGLLARAASDDIREIRVWGAEEPGLPGSLAARVVNAGDETADQLMSRCEALPPVNLMEGDFAGESQGTDMRRVWRMAAVAAGAWLVLSFGYALTDYRILASRSEHLGQQIEAVFRETFPEGERMVNPRVQMERALAAQGGHGSGGALLPVLDWLTPVVARTAGLDPVAMDYRDGQLDLDLRATALPVLDRFLQGLAAEGRYRVKLQSAVQNADGVRGIIRVSTEP